MEKKKRYSIPLSSKDVLDAEIMINESQIIRFALNLRTRIDGIWYQVYRVDTAHGYLHEQRFWVSPEPIPLMQQTSMDYAFEFYMRQIKDSYERYRKYYIGKMKGR